MSRARMLLFIGCISLVVACAGVPPSPYTDLEVDLSPMNILPVPGAAAPAAVTPEEAITRVESERGSVEVVRLGRRWASGRTVWVVVFRPAENGDCADCWVAWTIDDQTREVLAAFEAASLRAFGVPPPAW